MKSPTLKEKVEVYESVLHRLQTLGEVAMNGEKLNKLLHLIYDWSYSHRVGNGDLTEKEQQELINKAFQKLKEF